MDYKSISRIQTLLPLGYFYLIILGILKDGVFFYMLGINFIKFSSITDVLMSPIADLTLSNSINCCGGHQLCFVSLQQISNEEQS